LRREKDVGRVSEEMVTGREKGRAFYREEERAFYRKDGRAFYKEERRVF